MVERVHGSGTFVSEPRLERGAAEFFHFTERVRERGEAAGSRLLSLERVVPSPLAAQELELSAGTDLYRGDRVRFVTDAATVAVPIGEEVASEPTRR